MTVTPRQKRFIEEFGVDGNAAAAARRAGYSERSARVNGPRLLTNAAVRQAIVERQERTAKKLEVSRQDVVVGLLQGIEMARMQGDGSTVIRGWAEIGKLLGLYSPERKAIAVTTFTASQIAKFEGLSDEELIALSAGQKLVN